MKKWGKWLALVLVCTMLLEGASLAVSRTPRAEAAVSTVKELRFKIGSEQATVNGTVIKIGKPYQVNGTTMVPASMLKQAFGVTVTWTVANKEFTLAAGNRKAKMTVGKTRALVNRKEVIMTQAPVLKNGHLMVPLRTITEMMNATLSAGTNGQTIVKWNTAEAKTDMSRVGNKKGNWSIYLPEDWYYVDQTELGYVSFYQMNGKDSILLEIYNDEDVEPAEDAYELIDLLAYIVPDNAYILDGSVAVKGPAPYAQLNIGYFDDKGNIEGLEINRLYQANKKTDYYLRVYAAVPDKYLKMLNSFRPSYTLSGVPLTFNDPYAESQRNVTATELGVTFTVPAHWYVDAHYGYAESPYGMLQLDVSVQDAKGLKAEQIAKQRFEYVNKTYIPGTFRIIEEKAYTLTSGQTGVLHRLIWDEGRGKYTEYVLDVVDNGLNYTFTFSDSYEAKGSSKDAVDILKTIKLDASQVTREFKEPAYMLDWNALKTHELSMIPASIELPAAWADWTEDEDEGHYFRLPFEDMLTVGKVIDENIADVKMYEDDYFKEYGYIYSNVLDETKTINGKQVRFLEYKYKKYEDDFEELMSAAFIQDGEDMIAIYLYAYTTSYSDSIKQQLRKAVESLVIK